MNSKYISYRLIAFSMLLAFLGGASLSAQVVTDVTCPGSTFDLSVDNFNNTTIWQWSDDGINWNDSLGTDGLGTITITPPQAGRFYRAVTIDNDCEIASQVMDLRTAALSLDLGADLTPCSGAETSLVPTLSIEGAPASVNWPSPTIMFVDPTQLSQDVSTTVQTSVTLTVTDTNGCIVSDTVNLDPIPLAASDTVDYLYFGDQDTFFVLPTCIDTISFELWGAPGNPGSDPEANGRFGLPGLGGFAGGDLLRDPNLSDTVWLFLGGTNGFNGGTNGGISQGFGAEGGGGGGATDIRYGGKELSDRVAIAGGGGGGGGAPRGFQVFACPACEGGDGGDGGSIVAMGDSVSFGENGGDAVVAGSFSPASG